MSQQVLNLEGRLYTREHEWVAVEGDVATVGITGYAAEQLGDVVYLGLPKKGSALTQGGKLGEVESVKAVSDIFSPVTGTVIEVNPEIAAHPELVNQDAEGLGWLVRATYSPGEFGSLMTRAQYQDYLTGQAKH